MRTRIFLLCLALSATAWGAEPAAGNTAAPADTPATATTSPAQQQTDSAPSTTAAPQVGESTQQKAPAAPAANSQQKSAAASSESGFSRGSVVRSVFAKGVKDREPVNTLKSGKTDDNHLYYYTELRDMSGQTAVHRWSFNGKVVAEVKFKVRGPRWRVWSSKTIPSGNTGEWKVSVLNGAGQVIAEDMIDYTGQAPAAAAPATGVQPESTQQQPAAGQSTPADTTSTQQQPATDQSAPTGSTSTQSGGNGGM